MSVPEHSTKPLYSETGVDISVPYHQEIEGPLGGTSIEYVIHTVVKQKVFDSQAENEESLEYKIPKTYRECEAFYNKMCKKYPNIGLPSIPSPSAALTTDDRQKSLNALFKFISTNSETCTCQILLTFLDIDPSRKPQQAPTETETPIATAIEKPEPVHVENSIFEKVKLKKNLSPEKDAAEEATFEAVVEEGEDPDLFQDQPIRKRNGTGSKPLFDQLSLQIRNEKLINKEPLLFDPQDYGGPISSDEEHLFLVPGARTEERKSSSSFTSKDLDLEEEMQLFNVEDDLSDLLDQVKTKRKSSSGKEKSLKVAETAKESSTTAGTTTTTPSTTRTKPTLPPKKPAVPPKKPIPIPRQKVPLPKAVDKAKVSSGGDTSSSSSSSTSAEVTRTKPDKPEKPTNPSKDMDDLDILKYIEENEMQNDDLSLFS